MARPAQASAEASRRRLVDVALPLFAQHGYRGTSLRMLCSASGFSIAVISLHFGGKQKLYDAVVDEVYRRLGARASEALAGVQAVDVGNVMALLYSIARDERDGVRVLVRQVLDHGRLTAHTEAKHFLPEIEKASKLLAKVLDLPAERARTAAVTVGYLLSRFVIQDERSLMAAFGVRSAKEAHARVIETLTTTTYALLAAKEPPR
jgi:AcrR family transcriptional regulator